MEVATAAEDELGDGEDPPVVATTLMLPPGYAAIALLLKSPLPLADDWVPLDEAAKYLPKKCAQDLEKLQAELADQRSLVDLQARKVVTATPAELLAAEKKVETIEKLIEKAGEESTMALAASELDVGLKKHSQAETMRTNRADKGGEKQTKGRTSWRRSAYSGSSPGRPTWPTCERSARSGTRHGWPGDWHSRPERTR